MEVIFILAEGAMTLPVTLSGGVLFASWKLLQFLSSLIVKVILAIFMRASAQYMQDLPSGESKCIYTNKYTWIRKIDFSKHASIDTHVYIYVHLSVVKLCA